MAIAKEERQLCEHEINTRRHEEGLQQMRAWIADYLADLGTKWPYLEGAALTSAQGAAHILQTQLRVIDNGPKIKPQAQGAK